MRAAEHRDEAYRLYSQGKSCCAQIHEAMWREKSRKWAGFNAGKQSFRRPLRPLRILEYPLRILGITGPGVRPLISSLSFADSKPARVGVGPAPWPRSTVTGMTRRLHQTTDRRRIGPNAMLDAEFDRQFNNARRLAYGWFMFCACVAVIMLGLVVWAVIEIVSWLTSK